MAKKEDVKSVYLSAITKKIQVDKEKIVTSRIPFDIYSDYEKAIKRLQAHGSAISITNVIKIAIQEATAVYNSEADRLDAESAKNHVDNEAAEIAVDLTAGGNCPKCKSGILVENTTTATISCKSCDFMGDAA